LLLRNWEVERKGLTEAGTGMLVDYWFWIFRDPVTRQRRSTGRRMTAVEAQKYPMAQPVQGTLQLRNAEIDFEDTVPLVFHHEGNH
jgi:hypothetical protein